MAVNTAALKTFAPAMRRQLMEAVGRKLDLLLNSQTPDTLSTYAKQIAELREEQEKSREQLLERVAYTWFNRLCALRYLDAKGWHPFGCKVLMPADGSETQPELLKLMRSGSLPADLKAFTNEQRLNQLLDGQIPTAIPGGDAQGEVYRELALAACRSYHNLLPDLFEGLDDASELLLPDDLLTEGSIAGSFRNSISDSDCEDVEIIGWLYQFYISEKKDEVIGKVVKSEDIPAATQLFTPNWIVKYMVQNTIGAQWLSTYPDSPLREQMEFYIEPAEQTDEVKARLAEITATSLNPEELTLMDPACGSGHILVEAYEVFKAIYLEQGYQLREIPKLILEKNLHGLDIDKRASQLTNFSLIMKAREDDRRIFQKGLKTNVVALQNCADLDSACFSQLVDSFDHEISKCDLEELKKLFSRAETVGSLIKVPDQLAVKIPALLRLSQAKGCQLFEEKGLNNLLILAKQAELLTKKFDIVVANPPYMGSSGMNAQLKTFAKDYFHSAKNDLFACFMQAGCFMAKSTGVSSMVTMQSWMFLSSFEDLRKEILLNKTMVNLTQIGYNSFPSMNSKIAQASVFTLRNMRLKGYVGTFFDLNSAPQSADKEKVFLQRCNSNRFEVDSERFSSIPGHPIAYWVSQNVINSFSNAPLGTVFTTREGMATADNDRFLRFWSEVSRGKIVMRCESESHSHAVKGKWFPYNKGGAFRRWYGNNDFIVEYENAGRNIKNNRDLKTGRIRSHNYNGEYAFREGLTWSALTSGLFSIRFSPKGSLFDSKGAMGFSKRSREILSLLNSSLAQHYLSFLSPTLDFKVGDIAQIPLANYRIAGEASVCAERCIDIAKADWDSYERSWDFQAHFLIRNNLGLEASLRSSYLSWLAESQEVISELKTLEERNNRLFIEAYGLSEELSSEVPIEQITLTVNPAYRYVGDGNEEEKRERFQRDSMAELLSYATGCMMGRYSLDHPGLILADSRSNQDEQIAAYEAKIGKSISEIQFKPDADAIIPVLDGEWFEDDIVTRIRKFLKVSFPESSVAENLRFIEDSIGKDIRKYFCKDFYKDHLQTYRKRPIYWMVQSPKAGFACLIYLHRYTPDTLLQVLNNYFRPYLQKLEARQEQLERDQNNDALPKREQTAARKEAEKITKVLKECQAWEQDALMPLAQQRIPLDLDDGVKVNYLKLQEVLAKIPGLAAKGD